MKLFTIILFAVTYILMIALPKKRPYVCLLYTSPSPRD